MIEVYIDNVLYLNFTFIVQEYLKLLNPVIALTPLPIHMCIVLNIEFINFIEIFK